MAPYDLAMAKAVERIPAPDSLPGGALYEVKWDGFRAAAQIAAAGVALWSRQGKDLGRWFPDLLGPLAEQVPLGCVVDGEIIVWRQGRLDFDALQDRLGAGPVRVTALAAAAPVSFVAFDLLTVMGQDVRSRPLRERRALLEQLAEGFEPPLQLSPATTELEQAEAWFQDFAAAGIEGLVVKGLGQPYKADRSWLKVKRRRELDVVCAGVIGPRERPKSLVIGLPIGGRLRIVGRSSQLGPAVAARLGPLLHAPEGEHPWPHTIAPRILDRFTEDIDPVILTLVEPLVVEISADVAWSGNAFRHSVRFLRVRPELDPEEVVTPESLRVQ